LTGRQGKSEVQTQKKQEKIKQEQWQQGVNICAAPSPWHINKKIAPLGIRNVCLISQCGEVPALKEIISKCK